MAGAIKIGIVIVLVAILWYGPQKRSWWWRDADPELLFGLLVLLGAFGALSVSWWMVTWEGPPLKRFLTGVVVLITAVLAASRNWTRRSLRWFGGISILLLGVLVIHIGSDDGGAQAAVRELFAASSGLPILRAEAPSQAHALADKSAKALSALHAAADAVRESSPLLAAGGDALYEDWSSKANAERREADQAAFDALFRPGSATAGEITLKAAVDDATASVTAAEKAPPADPTPAISSACLAAKRVGSVSDVPKIIPCSGTDSGNPLAVELASARLVIAKYRYGILARDVDKTDVESLTKALQAAQADTGSSSRKRDIGSSLSEGANVIVGDLIRPEGKPLVVETVAWMALLGLMVGVWRVVERRSGQQLPGPVTATLKGAKPPPAPSTDKADESKPGSEVKLDTSSSAVSKSAPNGDETQQEGVFREALLQNLPEPAAVPGAQAASPITDLAELVGVSSVFGKVAKSVVGLISKPGGYDVHGEVVAPSMPDEKWRVLVRVSDQTTNAQVGVKTVSGPTSTAACRAAGYWAAANILSQSTRIPSWATWKTETAEALAFYNDADDLPMADLERAVAAAPTSGVLLNALAGRYDLEQRHREALVLYSRAVSAHPRYPVARYRMALSTGIMACEIDKQWLSASLSERKRLTSQLDRACRRIEIDTANLCADQATTSKLGLAELAAANAEQAKAIFGELTNRLLSRLVKDCNWPHVASRTLRRSERIVWWPRLRTILRRHGSAGLAAMASTVRSTPDQPGRLREGGGPRQE